MIVAGLEAGDGRGHLLGLVLDASLEGYDHGRVASVDIEVADSPLVFRSA